MRLAVFDTNVIVSAGIRAAGPPARLVMDWVLEGQLQLATCPAVTAEYRRVLARPKFHRYGFPPIWVEVLIQDSLQLQDPWHGHWRCPIRTTRCSWRWPNGRAQCWSPAIPPTIPLTAARAWW
ncbi:MAG: PIN domain-containing protein [Xanthomonadales bacterium]|nr:PIN domain-containing protein [Xanthomonadales bacterium]